MKKNRRTKRNINISIVITPALKKVLDKITIKDTHISYGDFFRDAARDKIVREYPQFAKELGLKSKEEVSA